MTPCDPTTLHAHADAIEHAANLGGYVGADGQRVTLTQTEREEWAADAAVIRAAAYLQEQGPEATP